MYSKREIQRDIIFGELILEASKCNELVTLHKNVSAICLRYFPNASDVTIRVMYDFAYAIQNLNLQYKILRSEINSLQRKKR